ncbi:MAG: gliding motility-associated C-terminal domain-containing protein [Flavobacteriales bacterium]|nr:gliding motility-associated C-terminal domain-containing protein [Flavobacteriales bacterium]
MRTISYPTPLAAYSAELPGCATYPVPFTNNSENSSSWFWNFGDNTSTSEEDPAHVYDLPGIYDISLIAYGAGGCTDTLIVPGAVLINPTPVAYYTWDTLLSLDNALQFNNLSQDAVSWEWDFGDGSNTTAPDPLHVFPNGPGNEYLVCLVAINEFNCPDTICRVVNAPSDPLIWVPNAFTPNGDGTNEQFLPVPSGYSTCEYAFYVFDRWGERIFTATEPGIAWDGTLNGVDCKQDVYVWRVVFKNCTNPAERIKERDFIGHVTLLRGE